jgi:hypothetical protein
MNDFDLLRLTYRGGQVAIVAEFVTVLGLMLLLLTGPISLATEDDVAPQIEFFLQAYREAPALYFLVSGLLLLVGPLLMLWVVWAWHFYLEHEAKLVFGVWPLTSLALMGIAMLLLSFVVGVAGVVTAEESYQNGFFSQEAVHLVVLMEILLQSGGFGLLYVVYPLAISLVLWERRLYPRWLIAGGVLAFLLLNGLSIALCPFFMGVVLLQKAGRLAHDLQKQTASQPTR